MLSLQGYSAKCDRIFESLVNKAIKEKYPEKQRVDPEKFEERMAGVGAAERAMERAKPGIRSFVFLKSNLTISCEAVVERPGPRREEVQGSPERVEGPVEEGTGRVGGEGQDGAGRLFLDLPHLHRPLLLPHCRHHLQLLVDFKRG